MGFPKKRCILYVYLHGHKELFKRGIGSLFDPCVNAIGRRPHCPSRMEVSYCTFGFDAIIRRDLRTYIIVAVWFTARKPICVRDLSPRGKDNSHLTKLFGGLSSHNSKYIDIFILIMSVNEYDNILPVVHFVKSAFDRRSNIIL